MLVYIAMVCTILFFCFSFIVLTNGSLIEQFMRWAWCGPIIDFVIASHKFLMPLFMVGIAMKWVRDWRILVGIGVAFLIFLLCVSPL
jgi:hypothetical protein